MFQSKKPKSLRGVHHHACKFRLRTDVSRDTRGSRALNTRLPRVIAKRAIHYSTIMDGRRFLTEPMKFLVDMLNHTY